jgi:hypothetical protein
MVKSFAAANNLGIYIFVKASLLGAHKPSPTRLALGAAQLAADLDCTVGSKKGPLFSAPNPKSTDCSA